MKLFIEIAFLQNIAYKKWYIITNYKYFRLLAIEHFDEGIHTCRMK